MESIRIAMYRRALELDMAYHTRTSSGAIVARLMDDINRMNGLKTGLSFVLAAISVFAFVVAGRIAWGPAVLMMAAATVGGYAGAPLARALPASVVRGIVVLTGYVMTALFLWRI